LTYLFETLKTHGSTFSPEFWLIVANTIIFTIFQDLGVGGGQAKLLSKEEESVWTSTTLIQALRYLVEFFGERYDQVNFMLKGILEILKACLLQSNETLSRIGATCLQQIIETNLKKLDTHNWDQICDTIEQLVNETIPHAIFFDLSDGANGPNPVSITGRPLLTRPHKKDFEHIISVCVQHLLVLQTLSDILNSGSDFAVYRSLDLQHLNKFLAFFECSYLFAKEFNDNLEIRNALFQMGFMKNLPNLLKQETSSVSIYLTLLNRMYNDKDESRLALKDTIEQKMIP
jgi:brefeldin A-inhibited guanine nucleotide-exchange protein